MESLRVEAIHNKLQHITKYVLIALVRSSDLTRLFSMPNHEEWTVYVLEDDNMTFAVFIFVNNRTIKAG